MLSPEQRGEFERTGILRLPGAIPAHEARAMCDQVWDALTTRHRIDRQDPRAWKQAQRINGTHSLPKSVTFEQVASAPVCAALDELFGPGNWQRPQRWGSLLLSFPEADRWDVPRKAWHLDFPASASLSGLFALRIFTCLATLEPAGGGTVFVAGSHRLVEKFVHEQGIERLHSADARNAIIRSYPWMRALCSRGENIDRICGFMSVGTTVGETELRVIEMTGEPGDVMLTHPLLLHAPAPNCAAVPRIALSSTVFRTGVSTSAIYE